MISLIRLKNYKSIRDLSDLHLKPLNVFIGSNGAGKSNLFSFFQLLRNIYEKNLRNHIAANGGANSLLHFGRKTSSFLEGQIFFKNQNYHYSSLVETGFYHFILKPDQGNGFYFEQDFRAVRANSPNEDHLPTQWATWNHHTGSFESSIKGEDEQLDSDFESFKVYHFHDTGAKSPMKQTCRVADK